MVGYTATFSIHHRVPDENTLIDIISKEGKLSAEDAEDYLNELREEKRYQRDVY